MQGAATYRLYAHGVMHRLGAADVPLCLDGGCCSDTRPIETRPTEHDGISAESDRLAVSPDDRPVWPDHQLSAGIGHRPLRSALLLLHVGRHDVPPQGRFAHARGARSALLGI